METARTATEKALFRRPRVGLRYAENPHDRSLEKIVVPDEKSGPLTL